MDSRELFKALTIRKPASWMEARMDAFKFGCPLTVSQLEVLKTLPRVHVDFHVQPTDSILINENGPEHILIREFDDTDNDYATEAYYVNTEDYEYARYVMFIPRVYYSIIGIPKTK